MLLAWELQLEPFVLPCSIGGFLNGAIYTRKNKMHRYILNKMQLSRLFWDWETGEEMANSWPALPQEKNPRNNGGTHFHWLAKLHFSSINTFFNTHLSGKDSRFSKMYFSSTFPLSSLTVLFQTKLSSRSSLLRISSTKYCPKKEGNVNKKNRGVHAYRCIKTNEFKETIH